MRMHSWHTGEREAPAGGLHHEARERQIEAQRVNEAQQQHEHRLANKTYAVKRGYRSDCSEQARQIG